MEKEGAPVTNIKDYIVNMRRSGQADSAIVAQLTSVGWPADIVMSACNEANAIFPANPEKPEPTLQQVVQAAQPGPALNSAAPQQVSASTPVASGPATSAAVQAPVQNSPPSSAIANSDLFTQPPSGIFSAADKPKEAGSNEKKKFSLFALLSL
ncbi:MAG: hypothetical protein HGA85_08455, partial [Nanoarchaeota archaeon]|nr:hypothetical protein [Nanoarchaeota archaeon]